MRARRRRAGCGGGPKGRAGQRRRLSSPEPRARAAPWPGPRAARGGAAGGRRGPAGAGAGAAAAAAAASRGSPGRSAAARTPPAREERSCCSSPGLWAPFRCAARRRRRPSESRVRQSLEDRRCGRRLSATGPEAPPVAAARGAPRGGSGRAGEEIRGGRALRGETDPRRQLERHASLRLKKDKPNQKGASFCSFLSALFQFLLRLLFPLPLQ